MSLTNAYTVLYNSADVETGTASNPLRVDPTGTTPQPVSGTVTANQGTAAVTANAWPIKNTDGTNVAAVKAASTAAIATDPALVVAVSPNNTVAISAAALPLPAGASTAANQTTLGSQTTKINDGTNTATVKAASTAAVATDTALVVAISPNNAITFTQAQPTTGTVSSVSVAVTSTTILASNASRKGAILWNSTGTTFVKLATAASTTSFTIRMAVNSEWELPSPVYTGIITGVSTTGTDVVLATELT